jgi:hypothetical protein
LSRPILPPRIALQPLGSRRQAHPPA